MGKLTQKQKTLIVTRLACWETPSSIRDELREKFDVEVKLNHIIYYDATGANPDGLHAFWRELFHATRAAFIKNTTDIAISHRSMRLRRADRLIKRLEEKLDGELTKKNLKLFLETIERIIAIDEQAAREVGDAYTNRRVLLPGDPEDELAKSLGWTKEQLRDALNDVGAAPAPAAGTNG